MTQASVRWTNKSVLALAGRRDPIEVITQKARALVFDAMQAGWSGPPFDPFFLADYLGIPIVPRDDILDARTVPSRGDRTQIEFNPNRPRGRVNFSVSHEIGHGLFPDCYEQVRNRSPHRNVKGDDWQLEMLCNIAAGELLMPIGSLREIKKEEVPTIDRVLEIRKRYDVSTEAVLLRIARIAGQPCFAFCASRKEAGEDEGMYHVDYSVSSKSWPMRLPQRAETPQRTVCQCKAIGFTAKGDDLWGATLGKLHMECVGIPAYPGRVYPRVAGLVSLPRKKASTLPPITYLRGDASEPRGEGRRIVAHVVNDRTPNWGAGFAKFVAKKWPEVQKEFRYWATRDRANLSLGKTHEIRLDGGLSVFNMVAQHGFGASQTPRIRYAALQNALDALGSLAIAEGATVHMPRIGCGQAGGSWEVVEELIKENVSVKGGHVFIYDLPDGARLKPAHSGQTAR